MPNNENAGMHYIHFASDHTALHEYDYDNAYRSKRKKAFLLNFRRGYGQMMEI